MSLAGWQFWSSAQVTSITSIWIGGSGADWSNGANWTSNPNYPNNGNGGFNYDVGISGGGPVLTEPISIKGFTFTTGIIAGDYDMTVNGLMTWYAGSLEGNANLHALGGMDIEGNVNQVGRSIDSEGNTTLGSAVQAIHSIMSGAVFSNCGTYTVYNHSTIGGNGSFNNYGTLQWNTGGGSFSPLALRSIIPGRSWYRKVELCLWVATSRRRVGQF
jgi:hypothetical protein